MMLSIFTLFAALVFFNGASCFQSNFNHQHSFTFVRKNTPEFSQFAVAKDGADQEKERSEPRRNFLASLTLAGVSALLGPRNCMQVASAVDFQVPDMSKISSGPNKQRVGGLANKIRNSCHIMVRLKTLRKQLYFCWRGEN